MVILMEEKEKDEQGTEYESEGPGSWLRDNLRIIISILIVVAIAGGVYSYSKRNQSSLSSNKSAEEQAVQEEGKVEVGASNNEAATEQKNEQGGQVAGKQQTAQASTSQETEGSFIESAGKGDGQTHLARRALANYLEKNPDSGLIAEHKIYIEDYLRKHSGFKGKVKVGTSIEFSKDLINKAIAGSKQLNDKQLQNLHKYAVRVPSLS
ncbi:MAG: hypothetical protein V1804_04035 [Patescibacteria group bacterium]